MRNAYRIGIAIGVAADHVARALDGRKVLTHGSMFPERVSSLVLQPRVDVWWRPFDALQLCVCVYVCMYASYVCIVRVMHTYSVYARI